MIKNMQNIKIIFIDLDGTLTDSNKLISPNSLKIIRKVIEKNITIVLCSGRTNSYVINYANQIGNLKYIISSNGAEIFDIIDNSDVFKNCLSFANVQKLWKYSLDNNFELLINTQNARYTNMPLKDKDDTSKIFIKSIKHLKSTDIYQIVVSSDDYNKMCELKKFIQSTKDLTIKNISHSFLNKEENKSYFFDIVNSNTSKGNAIQNLLQYLNISKKHTLCFGDSINDCDMFKVCEFKVAMKNSVPELKQLANYITLSNDEDGVAYFIENNILKNR